MANGMSPSPPVAQARQVAGEGPRCGGCGGALPADGLFCTGCGARAPGAPGPGEESPQFRGLLDEALAGLRRFWPALTMIAYLGFFDYRMHGSIIATVLLGGLAALPCLFFRRVQPLVGALQDLIPNRFLWPAIVGLPAAVLYVARWKGTQSDTSALLTAATIGASGFLIANWRSRINRVAAPFYQRRDRVLPRVLRLALVLVLPLLLTFLLVHRDLGDIGAVFGGTTKSPRSPAAGSTELAILVTTVLSASAAFLLLNEPGEGTPG